MIVHWWVYDVSELIPYACGNRQKEQGRAGWSYRARVCIEGKQDHHNAEIASAKQGPYQQAEAHPCTGKPCSRLPFDCLAAQQHRFRTRAPQHRYQDSHHRVQTHLGSPACCARSASITAAPGSRSDGLRMNVLPAPSTSCVNTGACQ